MNAGLGQRRPDGIAGARVPDRGPASVAKCVILVDNSNLFIGGQKLSAERKGQARNGGEQPADHTWRLSYDNLLSYLANGREVHQAIMVGSESEEHPGPWNAARKNGFEVIVHEREPGRGEKCADTELVVRGMETIATATEPMTLVVASGDRDMVPLVEAAHRHDWDVELCAFTNSYDTAGELAKAVDQVRPLDDEFDRIGFNEHG
jgi:uncharacterized LabA/DUF88 family protein